MKAVEGKENYEGGVEYRRKESSRKRFVTCKKMCNFVLMIFARSGFDL